MNRHTAYYPSGGWGYMYVGDPNYGSDRTQPGGWVFNVLPFMEQQSLHDLGGRIGPATAKQKPPLSRNEQHAACRNELSPHVAALRRFR